MNEKPQGKLKKKKKKHKVCLEMTVEERKIKPLTGSKQLRITN